MCVTAFVFIALNTVFWLSDMMISQRSKCLRMVFSSWSQSIKRIEFKQSR